MSSSTLESSPSSSTPKLILAIDPGKTFGWALFRSGTLMSSGHCSQAAWFKGVLSAQAERAGMILPPSPEDVRRALLVAEKPVYYSQGGDRSAHKGKPNDLITLGITLGEFLGLYRRHVDQVELVTAKDWKGSVDKDICHRRIAKSLEEYEIFPANHNARDAVGIGLWKVGRYRRGR